MKDMRSNKRLALSSESIRHLRTITRAELVRARGGVDPQLVDASGSSCITNVDLVCPRTGA
jgi:hypothetical protein